MPKYDDTISNVVCGDHKAVRRRIGELDVNDPVEEAWMTVRETEDVDGVEVFAKHITTTRVVGQGQVTVAMDSDTKEAEVLFEWTPEDTRSMTPLQEYFWDIQFRTEGGIINTPLKGTTEPIGDVTLLPETFERLPTAEV